MGFAVPRQLQRRPSVVIMQRTHCSVQLAQITSANEADLPVNRGTFTVHRALRTPARSCTDCSQICTEEPSPAAWDTVVGIIVVGTSSGCRLCTALAVCERSPRRGYAARQKNLISDRKQQSRIVVVGRGMRVNSQFTYSCTPVAIFCIERVSRLDGLLVRNALPSLFARSACAGVHSGERPRYRSQCSSGCCSLLVEAFFRGDLGH